MNLTTTSLTYRGDTEPVLEYFTVGLKYILKIADYDVEIMKKKVDTIIPERSETFMSTANKLREEGKLDGIKEGIKEGEKRSGRSFYQKLFSPGPFRTF